MIIDGSNQVLGRLASNVASKLLDGENVKVINANDIVITGKPDKIIADYIEKKEASDPHHGPYHPSRPDKIFLRSVKGMLPMKKSKGEKALKRITVLSGNPDNDDGEFVTKSVEDLTTNYITLKELSSKIKNR